MPSLDNTFAQRPSQKLTDIVKAWEYPLLAFAICFVIRLPTLFLGIDLSDMGFALTNQMVIKKTGLAAFSLYPVCFLSDYLASFWNSFVDPLGYVGVRLGNLILYSICAFIVTKVMSHYVKNKFLLLLSVTLASLVTFQPHITCQSFPFVGYYTIPMLLGILCISLNLSFIQRPTMTKSIMLATLFFLLFLSRFTMLPMVALCLISLFLVDKKDRLKTINTFFLSILVIYTFVVFANQFFETGLLKEVLYNGSRNNFGLSSIFSLYVKQLKHSLFWVSVTALAAITFSKLNSKLTAAPILTIMVLLFTARYMPHDRIFGRRSFAVAYNKFFWRTDEFHALGLTVGLAVVFFVIWFLVQFIRSEKFNTQIKKEMMFLFIGSLIFCFSIGFGSGGGLSMMGYGAWFLFPIAYYLAEQFPKHVMSLSLSMTVCAAFIWAYTIINPFRDEYSLGTKLSVIQTNKLKGTVTSVEKQNALDELFKEMSLHVKKGDKIFAYHSIPMVYWASETFPVTSHPWLWLFSIEHIQKELDTSFASQTPKIIVKAKFNSSEVKWIYKEESWYKEAVVEMDRYVHRYFQPKLIWTNRYFEILKPQNKVQEVQKS